MKILDKLVLSGAMAGMVLGGCLGDGQNNEELVSREGFTSSMAGTVEGALSASPLDIQCGEATQVTITLNGETGIAGQPIDIMLVLDESGSMDGTPLASLKTAAKSFVDTVDEATDGVLDGSIGNGSRIGVVGFSNSGDPKHALSSNATSVKGAIDSLSAGGGTDIEDGIAVAQAQFIGSTNAQLMIVMTDGQANPGTDPTAAANNAQAAGIEIFAIGLGNNVNVGQINSLVSDPVADHAFFTTDPSALQQIFGAIGAAITVSAATEMELQLTVDGRFEVGGAAASKGGVSGSGNSLTWTIAELGTETVTLTYTATHDNTQPGGAIPLHTSLTYSDAEGHALSFPNPVINVHGCAASLDLTPETDINIVGDDHTVVATVLDDFGDPVSGITVDFSVVGGPSSTDGEPSNPMPSSGSGVTDANGQTTFTYTNDQASTDTITATAHVQTNVSTTLTDTAEKNWIPIEVVIDIKPGSDPSSFGANSKGKIPVALLGSATLDVNQIDDSTIRFGDAPSTIGDAAIVHAAGHRKQFDDDGLLDVIYHFYFPDTNLDPSDTEGCLSGEVNGLDFMGCSDVNIVPN